MLALYLAPIYLIVLIWVGYRFHKLIDNLDIGNTKYVSFFKYFILIQFIFTAFIGIGFLFKNRFFTIVGSYWLGISLYLIIGVLISYVIRKFYVKYINKKFDKNKTYLYSFIFVIVFTIVFSLYGVINSRIIRTTNYDVNINKEVDNIDNLKIALIADTHFGYNINEYHLKQAVNIINNNNVDLLIIAGDIFDNDFNAIENPDELINLFKQIKTKYGIYCVLGNHDVEEDILVGFTFNNNEIKNISNEMLEFLDKANINILYDESILIDNAFYLYGRPDYNKPNFNHEKHQRVEAINITNGLDLNKPIICIDHEPKDFDELEKAGVDLDLSGHTHDGQIWPSKYLCRFIYKNAYGLYTHGNFNSITTSGLGLFGPNMRTFTIPEVAIINVNFK